jgi:hypothetical protein
MRIVLECVVFTILLSLLYLNFTDMSIDNEARELTAIRNSRGLLIKEPKE